MAVNAQDAIVDMEVGPVVRMAVSNMRNGLVDAIVPALARGTIPATFGWRRVNNLAPVDALEWTGIFVRTYLAVGLPRTVAILLGAARSGMTAYYTLGLVNTDLVADESLPALYEYAAAAAAVNNNNANMPARPAVVRARQGAVADNAMQAMLLVGRNAVVLTSPERELAAAAVYMGIAALPLNGLVLVDTGHHYLPSHRAVFTAVERQVLAPLSAAAKDLWTADIDLSRDTVWHKAGHPVNMDLKRSLALDPMMAARLVAIGIGSAAVRLPAKPSAVHNALSALAVLSQVVNVITGNGGAVNYIALEHALHVVEMYPPAAAGLVPVAPPADWIRPNTVPVAVNSHSMALAHLRGVLDRNADTIAFAYGVFNVMVDRSAKGTSTLRKSYTLNKIADSHMGAMDRGTQWARAVGVRETAAAAAGTVAVVNIVMV